MAGPDLGKMIGPLPLGAWVGVVGAGVGVAYLAKKKGGAAPAPVAAVPDSSGADDVRVITVGPTEFNTAVSTPRKDSTNAEWQTTVAIELIGRGFGALATNTALTAYLRGDVLTGEQKAIVEAALRISQPPFAPPPPANVPPVTTTPPKPTTSTVQTLWRFSHTREAGRFFYTSNPVEVATLKANPDWHYDGPALGPGSPGYAA